MCVSTVSYTQQNYDTTTQKLAFKCEKSFSGARSNFYQQNPCMTSGIMFITIPYYIICYLLYRKFLTVCAIAEFLIVPAIL